jgi:hypothetical protein
MTGFVLTIPIDGNPSLEEFASADDLLAPLQKIVGGSIEAVPYFDTIERGGAIVSCVAFCNEDGKFTGLAVNADATALWDAALARQCLSRFDEVGRAKDYLVGAIAVVFGDEAFMRDL